MTIKDYVKLFNKTFEEIKTQYISDFEFIFNEEMDWLGDLENKTKFLKKHDDKIAIDHVISKIKSTENFTVEDNPSLIIFISKINSIVLIADRINNFVDGKKLSNGKTLKLFDLFNEIKKTSVLNHLKFPLNNNLDSFIPHLFSIVKHCQNPQQYPIYYK